jgi:hypothetical protein
VSCGGDFILLAEPSAGCSKYRAPVCPTVRQPSFGLRFTAYGKRRYLNLGRPEDGWTLAMAQRELAVVLRDVDLGTWRPPQPDPAPAKDVDPAFHQFASDWFATKRLENEKNTASSEGTTSPTTCSASSRIITSPDHGRGGRPLPAEQGAGSGRDHGSRRKRHADDVFVRRPPRPRPPPPRASPVGALDQHAHRPAGDVEVLGRAYVPVHTDGDPADDYEPDVDFS